MNLAMHVALSVILAVRGLSAGVEAADIGADPGGFVQESEKQSVDEAPAPWHSRIEVAVGATAVLQGSTGAAGSHALDGSLSFDLELTAPVGDAGLFYSLLETGTGDGIGSGIATLSGFNAAADDGFVVRLTEAWYQRTWPAQNLWLRVGKVDLSTDFDTNAVANSETEQFLSGGFVNNLALEFPEDSGPGVMLWVTPSDRWALGAGVADADADGDDLFGSPFAMAEISYRSGPAAREGNWRLYGWVHGGEHGALLDPERAAETNRGLGLSLDQQVSDATTLFARWGRQRGDLQQIETAWSLGLQHSCGEHGVFGLAYGRAVLGDDWKRSQGSGVGSADDESHLELYYSHRVDDNLTLTPDIQWVGAPGGDGQSGDVWAFGVRAQLAF
jgi:carbohydrate-selective porin OprB